MTPANHTCTTNVAAVLIGSAAEAEGFASSSPEGPALRWSSRHSHRYRRRAAVRGLNRVQCPIDESRTPGRATNGIGGAISAPPRVTAPDAAARRNGAKQERDAKRHAENHGCSERAVEQHDHTGRALRQQVEKAHHSPSPSFFVFPFDFATRSASLALVTIRRCDSVRLR